MCVVRVGWGVLPPEGKMTHWAGGQAPWERPGQARARAPGSQRQGGGGRACPRRGRDPGRSKRPKEPRFPSRHIAELTQICKGPGEPEALSAPASLTSVLGMAAAGTGRGAPFLWSSETSAAVPRTEQAHSTRDSYS